jgi:hypothetical protein
MSVSVLLITPPFTQLNTPYPATAYLKGFLRTKGIDSFQCDLGIEVTLDIFCRTGLTGLFSTVELLEQERSPNLTRILALKAQYINRIDPVIQFLQGKQPNLAHMICNRGFLPEASRFEELTELEWAFGTMGVQDRAKHLATLFLEDLSDFIKETVDPHFGFSRYAERLARSAHSMDELYEALSANPSFVDVFMLKRLDHYIEKLQPTLVCFSVPFPGNVYAALRSGRHIKNQYPQIKIAMGGGFPNTELRSVSDHRLFEFVDFVCLDDGEAPLEQLIQYIDNKIELGQLKRTFIEQSNQVFYVNNSGCSDYKQADTGTPDYSDLKLTEYISAIEVVNPMHRMWSDGRWNKLTMAHGCYWGKCTFCDISLDYIKNYEPLTASMICDRMEAMIEQTGERGFHFVDEAAPPSLMKAVSIEILRRGMTVSWWTNIRFEKSFTADLCRLLKASGCIGVSGGLEVASDRLLQLIQKGVTVAQVAQVNKHFTEAGILVHAYLMYGFPTQTIQETIDSLEMVRQLFKSGVLQSGFWHLFTMTAHSPVGMNPQDYQVKKVTDIPGTFANNDIAHIDDRGIDHEGLFSYGLKKALYNYMHAHMLDEPLHKWFDHKIPKTSIAPDYIERILSEPEFPPNKPTVRIIWLGQGDQIRLVTKSKKGQQWEIAEWKGFTERHQYTASLPKEIGNWWLNQIDALRPSAAPTHIQALKASFELSCPNEDFELTWCNKIYPAFSKYCLIAV